MLQYFLGFSVTTLSGFALVKMLLVVYERMRTHERVPPDEHVKWHVRRAIKKTSVGAGIMAGAIWVLAHSIF